MSEVLPNAKGIKRPPSSLLPKVGSQQKLDANAKGGYPITFQHLGKRGYVLSLFAATVVGRRKWMEHIEAQQTALRERSNIFTKTVLSDDFFNFNSNKVNCLVPMGKDSLLLVLDRRCAKEFEQMEVASWFTVPTQASTSQTVDQVPHRKACRRRLSIWQESRRLMS